MNRGRTIPFRDSKKQLGIASQLPAIANSSVTFGDVFYATDTGVRYEVTSASGPATGTKQWSGASSGGGFLTGNDTLGAGGSPAGTRVVTGVPVTAGSRIYVSRRALPGGGTAIGAELAVVSTVVNTSFTVNAVAEATQAIVAADTGNFDWLLIG